jgi:hypothetical protein
MGRLQTASGAAILLVPTEATMKNIIFWGAVHVVSISKDQNFRTTFRLHLYPDTSVSTKLHGIS